jgi:anaphase-promoting complex subunit 10
MPRRRHLVPHTPPGHRPYQEQIIDYNPGPSTLVTNLPDIGHLAKWSVSSHKFGFGAECLRDDDPETFWQCVLFGIANVHVRYHWVFR